MSRSRFLLAICIVVASFAITFAGSRAGDQAPAADESGGPGSEQTTASEQAPAAGQEYHPRGAGRPNVRTDFSPQVSTPRVDQTAYLDPDSSVIGDVIVGRRVFVAPFASVRGDEGQPVHVGDEANVQDGVVVHALANETYQVNGKPYAVYLGDRVSLAHQAQVHGPAWIEDDTFVGMQAFVFQAHIGKGCVIEPGAKVAGRTGRIEVAAGRFVEAGALVTTQAQADRLPRIVDVPGYPFRDINKKVVRVNVSLADGYNGKSVTAPPPEPSPAPEN